MTAASEMADRQALGRRAFASTVPLIAGSIAIIAGSLALLGWALDVELLTRIGSGLPVMKANTALALIGAGAALILLRQEASVRSKRAGRALGAGVAAFGVVVGAEYLFGGIGIDQLLFADAGSAHPGRPSPQTAIALAALGLALATVDTAWLRGRVNTALIAIADAVVLFSLVGYVYGVDYLRSASGTIGMALHTVIALVVLSVGITCLRPHRGLVAMLRGDDTAARMCRALLPVALVLPFGLGAVRLRGQELGVYGTTVGTAGATLMSVVVLTSVIVFLAQRLRVNEAGSRRLAAVVESSGDAITTKDPDGTITSWNAGAERIYGYAASEAIGRSISILLPPEESGEVPELLARACAGELIDHHESERIRKDGERIDVSLTVSPIRDAEGRIVGASTISRDITARKEAERRLRRADRALAESEERFRRSFEDSGVGMALVAVADGQLGRMLEVNDSLAAITGYAGSELKALGALGMVHPDDQGGLGGDLAQLLAGKLSVIRREARLLGAGGEVIWAGVTVSLVRDAAGKPAHCVMQVQDVGERKRFEGQLQFLADHDALTGLFNRRRFEQEMGREVAAARRYGASGAVLVLDLDHFKYVNDSLGHAAGDELIAIAAQALRRRLRETDILGRLGGDEFGVILPRAGESQARAVAQAMLSEIREDSRAASASGTRRVTASLGIAMFGKHAEAMEVEELLSEADIAMYDAKDAGRDRVEVYDAGAPRHERMRARVAWEQRIEAAVESDDLVLHAQPILDLNGGAGRHELLLRMIGENGDRIPPRTFLYVAERSELIQRIDRWVVEKAVELSAEQSRAGNEVIFEVNLSGKSINDAGMADFIAASIAHAGAEPERLIFEVTETAAIVNVAQAKTFARRLHEIGCGFALDDFGAGFASFYYLKHLSFDYLKIDGEFIQGLTANRTNQLVVRSVVDIARGLGKRTIAEFVGDQATLDLLREYGVDCAQGFFIGRPRPISEVNFANSVPDLVAR